MSHHENLKVLILTSRNPMVTAELLHFLTEKGYPKVDRHDMVSQIEHLANAGQHRLVTADVQSFDEYHDLRREFHGEVTLVGIAPASDIAQFEASRDDGKPRDHLVEIAGHYIAEADAIRMQHDLHALLEDIHFLN